MVLMLETISDSLITSLPRLHAVDIQPPTAGGAHPVCPSVVPGLQATLARCDVGDERVVQRAGQARLPGVNLGVRHDGVDDAEYPLSQGAYPAERDTQVDAAVAGELVPASRADQRGVSFCEADPQRHGSRPLVGVGQERVQVVQRREPGAATGLGV